MSKDELSRPGFKPATMPDSSRSMRFARSTLHYLMGEAALFILSVSIIPYLVRRLGPSGYSLYSLMGILSGYMALFTAGSGTTAAKLVAECAAQRDRSRLSVVLRISLALFLLGAGLAAVTLLAMRHALAQRFLNIPLELLGTAQVVFFYAAVGGFFYLMSLWCGFVLQGLQRFDLLNILSVLRGALVPTGSLALLCAGFGLETLGQWFCAAHMSVFFLGAFWTRDHWTQAITARSTESYPGMGKTFLLYNVNTFAGQLAWTINCQLDKLWIGHLFPIAHLAYYVIPSSLAQRLGTAPAVICQVVFPMASEISGLGRQQSLKRLYLKASKVLAFSLFPFFVVLFTFAPQILHLWLGPDFQAYSAWPMRWLLVGWSASILTGIPFHVALGLGRPMSISCASAATSVVLLAAWSWLIPRHGILGASIGFCGAQILVTPIFVAYVGKSLLGIGYWQYLRASYLQPTAAAVLAFLAAFYVRSSVFRLDRLALAIALIFLVYFAASYAMLDEEERDLVRRMLKREKAAV